MKVQKNARIAGVILVGGKGRRMGFDKASCKLGGYTLFEYTAFKLRSQCDVLALSVSAYRDDLSSYRQIPDETGSSIGAIQGLLQSLRWAKRSGDVDYLLTSPVDTPFLPEDFSKRLLLELTKHGSQSAVAVSSGRVHGLSALYRIDALKEAEQLIERDGERMIQAFHKRLSSLEVKFATDPIDPFFNVNSPADLRVAEIHSEMLR